MISQAYSKTILKRPIEIAIYKRLKLIGIAFNGKIGIGYEYPAKKHPRGLFHFYTGHRVYASNYKICIKRYSLFIYNLGLYLSWRVK